MTYIYNKNKIKYYPKKIIKDNIIYKKDVLNDYAAHKEKALFVIVVLFD